MLSYLKNLGLSDKEAKVYLAMLELGPSPVLEISAKADVNRPTAYVQIEALKEKGLVSSQLKGKKQLYIAESPEQLGFLLEREKENLEQKKSEFMHILPDLKTMFNLSGEKPQVRYFEGREGLLRMQEGVLKSKEKLVRVIASLDDALEAFPEKDQTYTVRRVKKGIRSKFLYTSRNGPILKASEASLLRETRFVDPKKLPFSLDVTLFDDVVEVAALKGKMFGAVIEHKEIANSFKNLFDFVWNMTGSTKQ